MRKKLFTSIPILITLALFGSIIHPKTSVAQQEVNPAHDIENITGISDILKSTKSNDTYTSRNTTNDFEIPKDPAKPIQLDVSTNISLPSSNIKEGELSPNGTIVYNHHEKANALYAVQPTKDGLKSLIQINNQHAPKEYRFDMNLPKGSKLVSAAEYLGKEFDTGEVYVVNEKNMITSIFSPAWAKDANNHDVPTRYETEGNTLIQVVEFNENTAFPIIADPDWGKIAACSAAITWFIGSNLFAAAKIIKVKKYIKELGGLKETAKLLAGATTWEEKLKVGGSAFKGLAAEITGVAGLAVCINW
ncbi:hypothetical protein [Bacillus sp. 179-C3.3 HS]|uniref:hypothetical protein n=1 Tax=Bacillus sp. 179-C3.3 HS TaxID=3232162 RepID=UPI0039A218D3